MPIIQRGNCAPRMETFYYVAMQEPWFSVILQNKNMFMEKMPLGVFADTLIIFLLLLCREQSQRSHLVTSCCVGDETHSAVLRLQGQFYESVFLNLQKIGPR